MNPDTTPGYTFTSSKPRSKREFMIQGILVLNMFNEKCETL